ncbi:hypothetical protein CBC3_p0308 (plasmid) [Clostridium botulinum V891]|nr:hypothetical protein CBC3_p0308 [Clostridium botulinum V891]
MLFSSHRYLFASWSNKYPSFLNLFLIVDLLIFICSDSSVKLFPLLNSLFIYFICCLISRLSNSFLSIISPPNYIKVIIIT